MTQNHQFDLSVLLYKEGDVWVAQCLQYDLAVQGSTIEDCKRRFERVFLAHVVLDLEEGREPLSDFQQAPEEFWERFRHGEPLASPLPMHIPQGAHGVAPPPWMIRAMAHELRVV